MVKQYDVVVIGSGPAGYVAAIRCAQLGFKTVCIEKWLNNEKKLVHGGTCLNVGCIPSKALLDSSHKFLEIQNHSDVHGIKVSKINIDVSEMLSRKDKVVDQLTKGVKNLLATNKVDSVNGVGKLIAADKVVATAPDGSQEEFLPKHVILASGSIPIDLTLAPINQETIVDSTGALNFKTVPTKLGIVGAVIIGLELGSVWARLGAEVTILEALEEFLPAVDMQIAKEAQKIFTKQGLKIKLGARVTGCKVSKRGKKNVTVEYTDSEVNQTVQFDKLIVAVGRRPYTEGLFDGSLNLELDEQGFVTVSYTHLTLPTILLV